MPTCAICMQVRPSLRFQTGRISLCQFCVRALNRTTLSARDAGPQYITRFRERQIRNNPGAATWPLTWFEQRLPEHIDLPDCVRRSIELRVLRAYHRHLICLDRRYLAYPRDWLRKRFIVKDLDDFACHICGTEEADGNALHVHHIIHRSRSGTNCRENLVTLCAKHHQAQHPDFVIGTDHGEPEGIDADSEEVDVADDSRPSPTPVQSPPAQVPVLPDVRPILPSHPVVPAAIVIPPASPHNTHTAPANKPSARADVADLSQRQPPASAPGRFPSGMAAAAISLIALVAFALAQVDNRPSAVAPPTSSPHTLPVAPVVDPHTDEQDWQGTTDAFIATRCELADTRPEVREQVARNYRIFQRELDALHGQPLSNAALLGLAGQHVYADPGYTPHGTCP